MINLKEVYKIQAEYGVADESFKDSEISFEDYLAQCRLFISRNLPAEYTKGSWDAEKKLNTLINLIGIVNTFRVLGILCGSCIFFFSFFIIFFY